MSEESRFAPLLRAFAVVWFAVSFIAWMTSVGLSFVMDNQQPTIHGEFPNYWIADASGYDGALQAALDLSVMMTIGGWLVIVGIVTVAFLSAVLMAVAVFGSLPFFYATEQIEEFLGGEDA